MSAASTYPTTVDSLPTTTVDNPDVSIALSAVEGLEINKWRKEEVAFAATVEPKPQIAGIFIVGALTGACEVKNPPTAAKQIGRQLILKFTQDATGSRTVTFASEYKVAATAVSGTASKVSTVVVQWDGTAWTQVGGTAGM